MSKLNIPGVCRALGKSVVDHLPGILTATGIVGFTSAIVFAVRATPKAMAAIDLAKSDKHPSDMNPRSTLNPYEVVKATWKYYIPTVGLTIASGACVIGGLSINARRSAAIATAYTLTDQAFREYQQKVVETVGEKKEEKIRSEVAQEHVSEYIPAKTIITGRGEQPCYDSLSERTFYSDVETLRQKANDLNEALSDEMFISVNEWYDAIGLSHYDPPGQTAAGRAVGDLIGWENGRGKINLEFDSVLIDGIPHIYIGYRVVPKYKYD